MSVCIFEQIADIERKMPWKGKELSNDLKEIAQKLFEAGKTIDYV